MANRNLNNVHMTVEFAEDTTDAALKSGEQLSVTLGKIQRDLKKLSKEATTTTAGLMSATDKVKLDNNTTAIEAIKTEQTTQNDRIKNLEDTSVPSDVQQQIDAIKTVDAQQDTSINNNATAITNITNGTTPLPYLKSQPTVTMKRVAGLSNLFDTGSYATLYACIETNNSMQRVIGLQLRFFLDINTNLPTSKTVNVYSVSTETTDEVYKLVNNYIKTYIVDMNTPTAKPHVSSITIYSNSGKLVDAVITAGRGQTGATDFAIQVSCYLYNIKNTINTTAGFTIKF